MSCDSGELCAALRFTLQCLYAEWMCFLSSTSASKSDLAEVHDLLSKQNHRAKFGIVSLHKRQSGKRHGHKEFKSPQVS